jgi:hypothetical protein
MVASLCFQDGTATYSRNKAGDIIPFNPINGGNFADLAGVNTDLKERFK